MGGNGQVGVFIESGRRRVFASALDWPGWARSGKTEEIALETLAGYLPRYLDIVRRAGLPAPAGELAVIERHPGLAKNADFGALGEIAAAEHEPLPDDAGARLALLLEASWQAFDEGTAVAPAVLRKGPRGGGRDTDQIVRHVTDAEVMFARKMGVPRDTAELRARIGGALRASGSVQTPRNGWPTRYAARRMAWHVLDHLWEIEDKSDLVRA
jgi:hypothetical protein